MRRIYVILCIHFLILGYQDAYAQKPADAKGAPIVFNNDTLLVYYAGQGLLTAKERAIIVTRRIQRIIDRIDFNPDSLALRNDSIISVITYRSQPLLTVTNKDASFSELSRQELAASYLSMLKTKLGDLFENNSTKTLIIRILEAIAVVAAFILIVWAVIRLFRVISKKVQKRWEQRLGKLDKKGVPRVYARQLFPLINNLIKVIRILVILALTYLALPVLFLIFPWTKSIATELLGYITTPIKGILLGIVHYIPNLLTIAVIYIATHYIIRLVKLIAKEIERGAFAINGFYPEWAMSTYNIIKVLLYAFMFVVIFPYLPGSQSRVFQGVTVFLGVLVSFGSSSAISNIVAGIMITYMRAFKIGDRIMIGNVIGDVSEKNMLITRIRTVRNEDITLPNSTVLSTHTINYSSLAKTHGLILHTSVTIGYDAPWRTVHELLINAALETENLLKDPKPFVFQTSLDDFYITYMVCAYTSEANKMAGTYSQLHQNIQDKFNEAGVEIMSPHYTSMRDGNHIAIPDDYVGKDYETPGFNVKK